MNPFETCSEAYERFRPGYPSELYDYLVSRCRLSSGSRILDVGAGTGKNSIPFMQRGSFVVAVEPSGSMAEQGRKSYPALQFVRASAEELPVASDTFQLVTAAQSFHWFDQDRTAAEVSRALAPEGYFAVYWNFRDARLEHVRAFEKLVVEFNPAHRTEYRRKEWGAIIEHTGRLQMIDEFHFVQTVPMSIEDWIGLTRSISYVQAIGPTKLVEFEKALRQALLRYSNVDCGYVTDLWLAQKTLQPRVRELA